MDSTTIQNKLSKNIIEISLVYKNANASLKINNLNILTNYKSIFVVAGDLNSKHTSWYSCITNKAGRTITQNMEFINTYTVIASESSNYHSFNMIRHT